MSHHVYILYSNKLQRFYVGLTINLDRRLDEHNKGKSSYTSTGTPWNLLWSTTKPTLSAAEILERKLKNLSRERKVKFMKKYHEGICGPEMLDRIEKEMV